MDQNVYGTGVTIGSGDVELKFYFKDEDINLGEEICSYMPKMCRTEFEIKSYRINKYYPEDLNLYTLLTNKKMTESVWNSLLDEFHIGGDIEQILQYDLFDLICPNRIRLTVIRFMHVLLGTVLRIAS